VNKDVHDLDERTRPSRSAAGAHRDVGTRFFSELLRRRFSRSKPQPTWINYGRIKQCNCLKKVLSLRGSRLFTWGVSAGWLAVVQTYEMEFAYKISVEVAA